MQENLMLILSSGGGVHLSQVRMSDELNQDILGVQCLQITCDKISIIVNMRWLGCLTRDRARFGRDRTSNQT